jgi:hypothetical protein
MPTRAAREPMMIVITCAKTMTPSFIVAPKY